MCRNVPLRMSRVAHGTAKFRFIRATKGQSLAQFTEIGRFAKNAGDVLRDPSLGTQAAAPASEQNHRGRRRVALHRTCYPATVHIRHTEVGHYQCEPFTSISRFAKGTN